ncbi:MAG: MarR family transcriptional regulator [Actinomycetota bacterium]|nr:MarR family transcriptional regulator [Actinomycetota bacterium]
MTVRHEHPRWKAGSSGVSLARISTSCSTATATTGLHATGVTVQDIDWLVAHLRAVVMASPTVWAGRGMTFPQLIALHLIGALAPVSLTELAQVLGTKPPATSAMVDRLTHTGLVRRTRDPHHRRRIHLTLTPEAQQIIGDTDPDTATRLQAVLTGMSPTARHHLIDILIDTIRRSID